MGYCRHAHRLHKVLVDGLDDLAAGRGEHDRLHIVPAAGHGIDVVELPVVVEELVLVAEIAEVHQDDLGVAWNKPVAYAALQVVLLQRSAERIERRPCVFLKIGIVAKVGTQQPVVLAKILDSLQNLAADDGVDAAYLVADFPGSLKQCDVSVIH